MTSNIFPDHKMLPPNPEYQPVAILGSAMTKMYRTRRSQRPEKGLGTGLLEV
jgi:hypothetical protein